MSTCLYVYLHGRWCTHTHRHRGASGNDPQDMAIWKGLVSSARYLGVQRTQCFGCEHSGDTTIVKKGPTSEVITCYHMLLPWLYLSYSFYSNSGPLGHGWLSDFSLPSLRHAGVWEKERPQDMLIIHWWSCFKHVDVDVDCCFIHPSSIDCLGLFSALM